MRLIFLVGSEGLLEFPRHKKTHWMEGKKAGLWLVSESYTTSIACWSGVNYRIAQ
jgi:hypothetical protein